MIHANEINNFFSLSDLTFLHESCKTFHGELVNFEKMVSSVTAMLFRNKLNSCRNIFILLVF